MEQAKQFPPVQPLKLLRLESHSNAHTQNPFKCNVLRKKANPVSKRSHLNSTLADLEISSRKKRFFEIKNLRLLLTRLQKYETKIVYSRTPNEIIITGRWKHRFNYVRPLAHNY